MMADGVINNTNDLKAEIVRLRLLKEEQKEAIAARFSSPSAIFHTALSVFPKSAGNKNSIFNQDIVSMLSRVLLPMVLNKTLFRNSGFLMKTLVGLVSQKASGFINEDSVTGLWEKVRSLFDKKNKPADYGIPPESEAS